ncbi:hypothetical protein L3X38_038292 [Prunus dulcis]|uniref:Uncharacterized protein n=1 Tax=Prunus dulcis TaxID=3755 RepID=A0AAD4V502_PRUDU|nr:hypothetical protein L3X38_038292 [Prunus dulcis]
MRRSTIFSNQHSLALISYQGGTCMGCGTSGHIAWFSCTRFTCNFNLCNPCVKLPPTAREAYKHDTHPHPVTLVEKRKSFIPFDKREHILPF